MVPWWTEECDQAFRKGNRAFRLLSRTHTMVNLIRYKRTTPVGQVWEMIKRIGGGRRDWEYPVMVDEGQTAVTDIEKVEIMSK